MAWQGQGQQATAVGYENTSLSNNIFRSCKVASQVGDSSQSPHINFQTFKSRQEEIAQRANLDRDKIGNREMHCLEQRIPRPPSTQLPSVHQMMEEQEYLEGMSHQGQLEPFMLGNKILGNECQVLVSKCSYVLMIIKREKGTMCYMIY